MNRKHKVAPAGTRELVEQAKQIKRPHGNRAPLDEQFLQLALAYARSEITGSQAQVIIGLKSPAAVTSLLGRQLMSAVAAGRLVER